jgi:L-threonylcarbamoyladenylate synthase
VRKIRNSSDICTMANIGDDILFAAELLKQGELVAIPTETVYGLAGNALNEDAILKIYSAKNRPKFDPLIAHTDSVEKIRQWVNDLPEQAIKLADAFWPGPLTMLLDKNQSIPDLLTSGLGRVAFRIPNHAMTLELLASLDFPLAAPSANPFGFVSPTQAEHVNDQLGDKLAYILDGGPCQIGIESTIVGFDGKRVIVYRLGGLSLEEIEAVVGKVDVQLNNSSNPVAPGMMKSHYSPGKPVIIGDIGSEIAKHTDKKIGIISFSKAYETHETVILSKSADIREAAKNIFQALRFLSKTNVDVILTETFPNEGLGRAINDRLQRAAAK